MADNPTPIEMQKYLKGVEYPASRDDLVSAAKDNGAPDDLVETLSNSGTDSFDSPTDVSAALKGTS